MHTLLVLSCRGSYLWDHTRLILSNLHMSFTKRVKKHMLIDKTEKRIFCELLLHRVLFLDEIDVV